MSLLKLEIDQNRIFGLDILRAFAIMSVVFGHGTPVLYQDFFIYFIFDGVSIFFVLSGFLVGGILIKVLHRNDLTNWDLLIDFWKRRWYRTLPAYFLILIAISLLSLLYKQGFAIDGLWKYFFFLQNFSTPHPFTFFPEAWSLSVEEWFYLIMPLLTFIFIISFRMTVKNSIFFVSIFILLFSISLRYIKFFYLDIHTLIEWDLLFRKQVITRLDSLMVGVLASFVNFYFSPIWKKNKIVFFVFGIIIFLSLHLLIVTESYRIDFFLSVVYFPLHALSVALLLPLLSQIKTPAGGGMVYTSITYISLSSYSMYLIHLSLVQGWLIPLIPFDPTTASTFLILFRYWLYWFVTVIGSILLYKYFEKPIMNLRERWSSKVGA